jgi:hypothetical protein
MDIGFDALGEKFDMLVSKGQSETLDQDSLEELSLTSQFLSLLTFRALSIAEAALSLLSTTHADESLSQLEDVPKVWFRPTLVRADSGEANLGKDCTAWPLLRATAVRCLALHASVCPDLAANHWAFFILVLKRHSPMVISAKNETKADDPMSSIVESCVHFLVDTQLVHRLVSDPEDVDARAVELFEAVAGLFGLPAQRMSLPPRLRRCLSERLCMLLLFGGVWNIDPNSNSGDSSSAYAPAGDLDSIPHAGRWVLTGLLVEAFYRPPPAVSAAGKTEEALEEASQEAAQRGSLLQFFCSLSDISGMHATLLAAACEGLLATELWRLAVPAQLGSGRRWCSLQLPRLLRLLSRHLVMAAGSQGAGCMILTVWLECIWRPLALLCLETKQDAHARHLLVESLLATLAAIEVARETHSHFASASDWPQIISEVSCVLSLIVSTWGWYKHEGADATCEGHWNETARAPLLRLVARFKAACADDGVNGLEKWESLQDVAMKRRDNLRVSFSNLGVNIQAIVESATESIRIRPSRAFIAGKRQRRRRTTRAMTPRQHQQLFGKGSKRRQKKVVVSDDDSEAPSLQERDDLDNGVASPPVKRQRKPSVGGG